MPIFQIVVFEERIYKVDCQVKASTQEEAEKLLLRNGTAQYKNEDEIVQIGSVKIVFEKEIKGEINV